MAYKKKYYLQLTDFSFYESSPFHTLPDSEIKSFKSAKKREDGMAEMTQQIDGLLSCTVKMWRQ